MVRLLRIAKMNKIDWDKPIETIHGGPAHVVGFSKIISDGEERVIVEYKTPVDVWKVGWESIGSPVKYFQNKVTRKSFHLYYDTDTRKLCGRSDDLEPYRDEIYIGEFAYDIPE